MKKLRLGTRLVLCFGVLLSMMLVLGMVGMSRMTQMHDRLEQIVTRDNANMANIVKARQMVMEAVVNARNMALMSDPDEIRKEAELLGRHRLENKRLLDKLAAEVSTPEERLALAKVLKTRDDSIAVVKKMAVLNATADKAASTHAMLYEVQPMQRKSLDALDDMVALESRLIEHSAALAREAYQATQVFTLAIFAGAVLVGSLLAWKVTSGILAQLGGEPSAALDIANRITAGDLSVEIDVASSDQASVLGALERMRRQLTGLVVQVREGIDNILVASKEVATGNLDLSQRTEEQAGALSETLASVEELTATVQQNSDNTRQASTLVDSACETAKRGGDIAAQVVSKMGRISQSSQKIVDIIAVIDGIAFQTNILALNAAVEAARAGEQGRGFAVVAGEVRTLAQRSAVAAKEIKELINGSVKDVGDGYHLVTQAGDTMREVISSVLNVTAIMNEIAASGREQAQGIEEVSRAIAQMDVVTQQNAAMVEEVAAASQSLQDQADGLTHAIGQFKVGKAVVHRPRRASASPHDGFPLPYQAFGA